MKQILRVLIIIVLSLGTVYGQQIGVSATVVDPNQVIGVATCMNGFSYMLDANGNIKILMPGDPILLSDQLFVTQGTLLLGGSAKESRGGQQRGKGLIITPPEIPRIGVAIYVNTFAVTASNKHETQVVLPFDFLQEGDTVYIDKGSLIVY